MKNALLASAALAAFGLAAAPVEAARCPSGQIWRVSKHVCVSKTSAIRDGVYKRGKTVRASLASRIVPGPRIVPNPPLAPPAAEREADMRRAEAPRAVPTAEAEPAPPTPTVPGQIWPYGGLPPRT